MRASAQCPTPLKEKKNIHSQGTFRLSLSLSLIQVPQLIIKVKAGYLQVPIANPSLNLTTLTTIIGHSKQQPVLPTQRACDCNFRWPLWTASVPPQSMVGSVAFFRHHSVCQVNQTGITRNHITSRNSEICYPLHYCRLPLFRPLHCFRSCICTAKWGDSFQLLPELPFVIFIEYCSGFCVPSPSATPSESEIKILGNYSFRLEELLLLPARSDISLPSPFMEGVGYGVLLAPSCFTYEPTLRHHQRRARQ